MTTTTETTAAGTTGTDNTATTDTTDTNTANAAGTDTNTGTADAGTDGPTVVGELETTETEALATLRRTANEVVMEIGQLEVRQARLMGSLSDIENRAQAVLDGAAKRFEIPQGTPWQVTPDGKAVLLNMPTTTTTNQ